MKDCPLYNGKNLNFTENENPYALIQKAGRRSRKSRVRKSLRKKNKKNKRKTRKYKR